MVKSVQVISKTQRSFPLSAEIQNGKLSFDFSVLDNIASESFDLVVTFTSSIQSFRNHDYTWVNVKQDRIAGQWVPKILLLENGYYVQPNQNIGYWEVNKQNPFVLLWRFNPEFSNPLTVYTGTQNERVLAQAQSLLPEKLSLILLFSNQNAVEFSRSPKPFLPVVCFTDHCDFDTAESLKIQRAFFKEHQVKVTKGFFLHHFSKRADNASYENDQAELQLWLSDGHELAYHSLSQSLKKDEEAFADFYQFTPPFDQCPTWIDHGYQPYNFSLYQNKGLNEHTYAAALYEKNIRILWNYIDSGTATLGVINQLNTEDFTLQRFSKGTQNLGVKTRIGVLFKNILFHYYADEARILQYKGLSGSFKKMLLASSKPIATNTKINKTFTKLVDGSITYDLEYRSATPDEIEKRAIGFISGDIYSIEKFDKLSPEIRFLLEKFIEHLRSNHIEISFFLAPYHPKVYSFIAKSDKYSKVIESENYFRDLGLKYEIKVIGSFNPNRLNMDGSYFYDGMHCNEKGIEKTLINEYK